MIKAANRILVDTNVLVYDTSDVTTKLLALVQSVPMGGKQIHDANLVATMQAYGIPRLLTHNTVDFTRFGTSVTVVPLVPIP